MSETTVKEIHRKKLKQVPPPLRLNFIRNRRRYSCFLFHFSFIIFMFAVSVVSDNMAERKPRIALVYFSVLHLCVDCLRIFCVLHEQRTSSVHVYLLNT